jgi:hypothetical protein
MHFSALFVHLFVHLFVCAQPLARIEEFPVANLNMQWSSLQDVEFLVNGSRQEQNNALFYMT